MKPAASVHVDSDAMAWTYEPDEAPKKKHRWNHSFAGFVNQRGIPVGKCPAGFSASAAAALLNRAFDPDDGRRTRRGAPLRLYAVHDGVVYRAAPTRAGASYHGFPERPRVVRSQERVLRRVREQADELGCRDALERWLEEWSQW
jgi:hypothetical protein